MAKATEYQKQVKRLNERMADIGRTYGTDTYYYRRYAETVGAYLSDHPELVRTSKSGNIALPTSEKYKDMPEIKKLLERIEGLPTKGEIHKEIKEKYGAETQEEVQRAVKQASRISQWMREHGGGKYETEMEREFVTKVGKRELTLDEQEEFIDEWEEMTEEEWLALPTVNPYDL